MDDNTTTVVIALIESMTIIFAPIIQEQIRNILKRQKKKPSKRKSKSHLKGKK